MSIPTVTFPVSFDQIPTEVKRLREFIRAHQQEIEVARTMLTAIRSGCDHKGAKSGHNERDGYWMAECPHCGMSR